MGSIQLGFLVCIVQAITIKPLSFGPTAGIHFDDVDQPQCRKLCNNTLSGDHLYRFIG